MQKFTEILRSLWKYHKDKPDNDIINSESFKFKSELIDKTNNTGIIDAKIAVPLKYLSKFWRPFEMSLMNCEINLIQTCSANNIIFEGNRVTIFAITYKT